MRKARQNGVERLESYLVKLIQEKGADRDQPGAVNFLLGVLKGFSYLFAAVVGIRYFLYRAGILRRFPLGVIFSSTSDVSRPISQTLFILSSRKIRIRSRPCRSLRARPRFRYRAL